MDGEDGGIALVGPSTSLAAVRAHLIQEAEDEDEDEVPAARLLASGSFVFMRAGAPVPPADEAECKAGELGDPIVVSTGPQFVS